MAELIRVCRAQRGHIHPPLNGVCRHLLVFQLWLLLGDVLDLLWPPARACGMGRRGAGIPRLPVGRMGREGHLWGAFPWHCAPAV